MVHVLLCRTCGVSGGKVLFKYATHTFLQMVESAPLFNMTVQQRETVVVGADVALARLDITLKNLVCDGVGVVGWKRISYITLK